MSVPAYFYLFCALFFALLSLYLFYRGHKNKKLLFQKDNLQRQRLYEISILKSIQDKIGYSLDTQRVVTTLVGSLKDLVSYTVITSFIIKDEQILYKTYSDEPVSRAFLEN